MMMVLKTSPTAYTAVTSTKMGIEMPLSKYQHITTYVPLMDDALAIQALDDLGIRQALDVPPPSLPWTNLAAYHHHPTLHVFAQKFEGLENPADNGYIVHLFPKSKFSEAQARGNFFQMCKGLFDNETQFTAQLVTVPKQT